MSTKDVWYVVGGEFTDGTFLKMVQGTNESYGPFLSEKEADDMCIGMIRRSVDICWHRLFVVKLDPASLPNRD